MTLEETQALLLKISLVEGREFTPLHAVAWQEILADKTSEEMFAALLKFEQKRPGVWLMPGHLIEIADEVTIDKMRDLSRYGLDELETS